MNDSAIRHSGLSLMTFLILLVGCSALLFAMVAPYVLAVAMGVILAVLSRPVYRRLRKRGWGPTLASGLVTGGIVLLVLIPLAAFSYAAVKQGTSIVQTLTRDESLSLDELSRKLAMVPWLERLFGTDAEIELALRSGIQSSNQAVSAALLQMAGSVPERLLQTLLSIIACFFLLIDGPRFIDWVKDRVPLDRDVRKTLAAAFKSSTISVIWATLAAAVAQAAVMVFAFLVLSVPGMFLAGGATFIFAWIPIVGSIPVWAAGTIYLYLQGEITKAVLMIVFGLITSVVDNFVRPLVLKGGNEMHALVSLVAIFGGIHQFGIFGVFYGPILAAVVTALLQVWPVVGRRFGLLPPEEQTGP